MLATIAALGFAASIAQLALMRELLTGFAGNELTIGVSLACWLVLTAVGTWIGAVVPNRPEFQGDSLTRGESVTGNSGRLGETPPPAAERPRRLNGPPGGRALPQTTRLALGTIIVALLAIAAVLALRGGRDLFFPHGVAADPLQTLLICAITLAPFCLGSGALLTLGCRALAAAGDVGAIGRVYSADAAGSVVGAALFTFVLSRVTDHVAALCWSASVVCAIAAVVAFVGGRRWLGGIAVGGAVALPLVAGFANLDAISAQWQHHGRIVYRASSPYGRLVVTREAGQLTFFENGAPVVYTANAVAVEELVHYALAQRPGAHSVLLIGSTVAGAAREVLRYPAVQSVTAIELDPVIVAAGRQLLPEALSDPRITVVTGDGRRFVQRSTAKFDAVLIGLPDPTTFQLNRFFTTEFLETVKRRLTAGGVLCFASGRYENFVSPELRQIVGSARRTLGAAFAHAVILPGGRVFFIGSDGPLTRDIAGALERQGIRPALVNRHYLDAMLTPDRLADIDRAAAATAPVNRDFHPVLYHLRLRQWLSQFSFPAVGLGVALAAILAVGLVRFRAVPRMIFAAGFAGSTLEIVLLVAFQAYFGSVYQQVGLIVGVFMAGLALGAAAVARVGEPRRPDATSPATLSGPPGGRALPQTTNRFFNHRWTQIHTDEPRIPNPCSSVFICGSKGLGTVRILGLAIAAVALVMAAVLPHLGSIAGITGAVIGQAVILAFTFTLAVAMGAQFAAATVGTPSTGGHVAPVVFSADLVGAALGAAAVSTLLLPLYGAAAVCLATAGLNLLAVGVSLRAHRA